MEDTNTTATQPAPEMPMDLAAVRGRIQAALTFMVETSKIAQERAAVCAALEKELEKVFSSCERERREEERKNWDPSSGQKGGGFTRRWADLQAVGGCAGHVFIMLRDLLSILKKAERFPPEYWELVKSGLDKETEQNSPAQDGQ